MTTSAIRLLLPLIALLLSAPALADTTATYSAASGSFIVEIDDGGNARAGIDGKFLLIRRDGVDYVVIYTGDGTPHVARADAALARFSEKSPPPSVEWRTELTSRGEAAVGGYSGTVWRFGPAGAPPLELVMSPDPALAPVGRLFARVAAAFAQVIDAHIGPSGDAVDGTSRLFGHGTPIRVHEVRNDRDVIALQSVSSAEIDSHRFDLPGPVLDTEAFFAAIASPPPDEVETRMSPAAPKP